MNSEAMCRHSECTPSRTLDRAIPARVCLFPIHSLARAAGEWRLADRLPKRLLDSRKSFRNDSNQVQSGGRFYG